MTLQREDCENMCNSGSTLRMQYDAALRSLQRIFSLTLTGVLHRHGGERWNALDTVREPASGRKPEPLVSLMCQSRDSVL